MPEPLEVRQGIIESWDSATGNNTIRVAGGQLVNVTAHKAGAAVMEVGDVVLLLSAGDSWYLLGTATTPGDPGTVPTWETDITALTPLVDLAAVTDGTTINGATLSTTETESGRRIVVSQDDNRIYFYSGEANEIIPAYLNTDDDELHLVGAIFDDVNNPTGLLYLKSSYDSGAIAEAELSARDGLVGLTSSSEAVLSVGIVDPDVPGDDTPSIRLKSIEIRLGDGTDDITIVGQAVTNADLSDPSNTFPANPQPIKVNEQTVQTPVTSTTFVAGSPVCGTAFTAPESGSVYITVSSHLQGNNAGSYAYLGYAVRTGGSVGSGSSVQAAATNFAVAAGTGAAAIGRSGGSRRDLITGLTPGASYNVRTEQCIAGTQGTIHARSLLVEPVL